MNLLFPQLKNITGYLVIKAPPVSAEISNYYIRVLGILSLKLSGKCAFLNTDQLKTKKKGGEVMALRKIWLHINGVERAVICNPEKDTLADVLRRMGLTGVKVGCKTGQCGSCSVLLNGEVVRSCIKKIKDVPDFTKIETIEGIGTPNHLHPLQQAWITYGGVQCGFCSPGFIVSAKGLLEKNPNPTREEVRHWFTVHRNACRCTGWKPLVDAVMEAAKVMRGEATMEDITFQTPPDGRLV
jgi:aldehyde oxidoreductase